MGFLCLKFGSWICLSLLFFCFRREESFTGTLQYFVKIQRERNLFSKPLLVLKLKTYKKVHLIGIIFDTIFDTDYF